MPKVSVIIPIYKVEQYLRRCVDSVSSQTLVDIEIILVDDGSPDGCPQICEEYKRTDSRVRVIHKENGGLASARNAGMRIAASEYIFFVDSDDWIDPITLQELVTIAERYQVDFVRFRPMYASWPGKDDGSLCDFGTERMLHEGLYDRKMIEETVYPYLIASVNLSLGAIVAAWRSLYRRESINGIEFNEEVKYSEDTIFSAKVVRNAKSFYYLDGPRYYHYFYNPGSITKSFRADRWESHKKLMIAFDREFGNDNHYDFTKQLWLHKFYCISSAMGEKQFIKDKKEREFYCRMICRDKITRLACKHVKLIKGSWKLKLYFRLIQMNAWRILSRI